MDISDSWNVAGSGKTHYIRKQLKDCKHSLTIAFNEAFNPLKIILQLRELPLFEKDIAIYINIAVVHPGVRFLYYFSIADFILIFIQESAPDPEKQKYYKIIESISWFFFDLLIIGYVEDNNTGLSFCLPAELNWKIFIEVKNNIILYILIDLLFD